MPPSTIPRVLFVCTNNSARSQLAEGLLRHLGGDRYDVHSAGTLPTEVNPLAIEVMAEKGTDITGQRSKSIDEFLGQGFDFVLTTCDNARDQCPVFPGQCEMFHWGLEDPAGAEGSREEKLKVFRRIRDELERLIRSQFLADSG